MKPQKLLIIIAGLAIAGVLIVALAFAAAVTIDTFDAGSQYVFAGPNEGNTANGYVDTAEALGGQRDVFVYNQSGGGLVDIQIDFGNTNQATFNQSSNVRGWGEIVWDGQDNDATTLDTTGLGGVDLTDGNTNDGFQLLVYYCDGGFDLGIWVYTGTASAYYTLTILSRIDPPGQSFFINFSDFTGDSSVFSDAGAVVFRIVPSANSVDLTIDLFEATANKDWGDLPDTYRTSSSQNGPYHTKGNIWLGTTVDLEADGFPTTNATGDDNNNYDDEDGIVRNPNYLWQPGNTVYITATVTGGAGDLYAWFDWNNDGGFSDESRYSWTGLTAGEHGLTLTVPGGFSYSNGTLAARFRLVPQGATAPDYFGEATNGEVEDYLWQFGPTAVTINRIKAGSGTPGRAVLLAVLGVLSTGILGLVLARKRA